MNDSDSPQAIDAQFVTLLARHEPVVRGYLRALLPGAADVDAVKLEWVSASQTKQVVPANRLYTTTEVPNGGSVMREVWTGLSGVSLTTLTSNANYPNKPASREFLTSFECLARDWEDNYGTRVTGFIRPPVSGSYTFAVSGDDVVQLYLSTDANAANKTLIARTATASA